MNSSAAKGPRNRTGFVTEENAGTGPDPEREVHILYTLGLLRTGNGETGQPRSNFNSKRKHHALALRVRPSPRKFFGGDGTVMPAPHACLWFQEPTHA